MLLAQAESGKLPLAKRVIELVPYCLKYATNACVCSRQGSVKKLGDIDQFGMWAIMIISTRYW
jgi:hypothetical protein